MTSGRATARSLSTLVCSPAQPTIAVPFHRPMPAPPRTGMVPVNPQSKTAQWLIQYTRCALDAIHFKNGPSHSKIMMTAQGPCLVEINCRCHGGNGAWMPLASALTGGYNQVVNAVGALLLASGSERPRPWRRSPQASTATSTTRLGTSSLRRPPIPSRAAAAT